MFVITRIGVITMRISTKEDPEYVPFNWKLNSVFCLEMIKIDMIEKLDLHGKK